MDLSKLSADERLVAEQAVLTLRALTDAAANAPQGQGLNALEEVIHKKGLEHLRNMMSMAAASRSEAQKKGSASSRAPAAAGASSKGSLRERF